MTPTRPTDIADYQARLKLMFSEQGFAQGLALTLRPTDVVITPYAKSGTTWMQQIVHSLRTDGDMNFDDISRVVPWIETSVSLGLDLTAEQTANPRAFKSHLPWKLVPKGGRYINVMRNPADVAVSLFKFQEGWFFEPGSILIDEFLAIEFFENRSYYKHLVSWWSQRHRDDVLFLCYEDMLRKPAEHIRRVAEFCDIALTDELLALAIQHSSIEFMLAHKDKFDDALMRQRGEEVAQLPPGSDSAKVRVGKAGAGTGLSPATLARLEQLWQEEIFEPLGFADYNAMTAALLQSD